MFNKTLSTFTDCIEPYPLRSELGVINPVVDCPLWARRRRPSSCRQWWSVPLRLLADLSHLLDRSAIENSWIAICVTAPL